MRIASNAPFAQDQRTMTLGESQDLIRGGVVSIEHLLSAHYFKPAAVQREFQWGVVECSALLGDFERAWLAWRDAGGGTEKHQQMYFVGSFVLKPLTQSSFEVFDGLQRLTTLTILFAVMRDLVDDKDAAMHARLSALVLDTSKQPHLDLGGADQTLANLIQAHSEAVRQRRNLSGNSLRARLLSAAGFFRSRLREMSADGLVSFADFVLTAVQAGIIEVRNERLARQIFITTNNRGIPLSEPDVLKSQINSIPFRQDAADRVLQTWNSVRGGFSSDADFTAFLYVVDFLTRRQGKSPEGLTALGEYLAGRLDDNSILEWLVDFEMHAEGWHLLNAIRSDPKREDPTGGEMFSLFAFDWMEWRPAALLLARQVVSAVAARDKRKVRRLAQRFRGLGRACCALTLSETAEAERARLFARALTDIEAGRDPCMHALAASEERLLRISRVLSGPVFDDFMALQVLRWLELAEAKIPLTDVLDAELSRVLPQIPEEASDWERKIQDTSERWVLAHAWGNLVLRIPRQGASEGFHGFTEWKKEAAKDSVRFAGAAHVLKMSGWTPDQIRSRTDEIRKRLLERIQRAEVD